MTMGETTACSSLEIPLAGGVAHPILEAQDVDPDFCEDDDDDSDPFCTCNDQPTFDEDDWNRCDCCGKAFA